MIPFALNGFFEMFALFLRQDMTVCLAACAVVCLAAYLVWGAFGK